MVRGGRVMEAGLGMLGGGGECPAVVEGKGREDQMSGKERMELRVWLRGAVTS